MSQNWDLIWELAKNDFKLRYKSSILGFMWSFFKPLFMLTVLYVVFSFVINQNIHHYALFLLLGILLWNFFVEATSISMSAVLDKGGLIKAVYFPRKTLIISACINALGTLVFNILIFVIFLIFFKITITYTFLIFILYVCLLFILGLGISYLLSSLYVKFRDIAHIWDVIVNTLFWVTPIIYSISIVPSQYKIIYLINPLATIINSARDLIIYNKLPELLPTIITIIIIMAFYILGYFMFKKRSPYFAEDL